MDNFEKEFLRHEGYGLGFNFYFFKYNFILFDSNFKIYSTAILNLWYPESS